MPAAGAIIDKPPSAPVDGVKVNSSTHPFVGATIGGVAVNLLDQAAARPARKDDTDDLGTGGSTTIDLGAGSFDHKAYSLNANATITITPGTSARKTNYTTHLRASTATQRNITWAYGGGTSFATNSLAQPPTFVDDTEGLVLRWWLDVNNTWHLMPYPTKAKAVTATTATTYTPDCGNGVYLEFVSTGVWGSASNPTELQLPINLPLNETMIWHLNTSQTHGFNVNAGAIKLGLRPDFDGKTQLGFHRNSDGIAVRGLDAEAWTVFT